jgi:hypothetical protein
MANTNQRSVSEIEAELRAARIKRDNFRRVINEGQGGYVDETEIEKLSAELQSAKAAASPLATDLAAERAWFNGQGFTGRDLAAANKACLARGYSLADLQAACKAAR